MNPHYYSILQELDKKTDSYYPILTKNSYDLSARQLVN